MFEIFWFHKENWTACYFYLWLIQHSAFQLKYSLVHSKSCHQPIYWRFTEHASAGTFRCQLPLRRTLWKIPDITRVIVLLFTWHDALSINVLLQAQSRRKKLVSYLLLLFFYNSNNDIINVCQMMLHKIFSKTLGM